MINPILHNLLSTRIGPVKVSNEGEPATLGTPLYNPRTGRLQSNAVFDGEYYRVACPYCGDSAQRLYVNHRWGCPDPLSGAPLWHLAICYNADCLKTHFHDFRERVFGWLNASTEAVLASMRLRVEAVVEATDGALLPVALPGKVLPVDRLDPHHPASLYLRDRGFDRAELAATWGVGLCTRADPRYLPAEGRLIAPIVLDGEQVGWQGRYVGERNWKKEGLAKYYFMPRFPKRLALYNHDRARASRTVIVTEGVTDVWAIGDPAVALFGKTITAAQRSRLAAWAQRRGTLVLVLDPEAWTTEQADAEAARRRHDSLLMELRGLFRDRVVEVELPAGRDPGSFPRRTIRRLIRTAARAAGVRLPDFHV